MPKRIRLPHLGLALPFAAVGGAAGALSYNLLINPAVALAPPGHHALAMACTALLAAAAGLLLAPSAPALEWLPPRPSLARVVAVVLAAGALAGALITCFLEPERVATGALGGLVFAVPFVPASLLMVSAARRASRARHGSIVARSDRRAVLAVLVATLGCSSALALPDWITAAGGLFPPPEGAVLLALASGVLVTGLLLLDLAAVARVRGLRAEIDAMESRRPEEAAGRAPRVDLGLGEQVVARLSPGTAYRGGERAVALIVGSPDEALSALGRSLRWGVVCLALLEVVGVGHGLAKGTDAAASYSTWLCEAGQSAACRQAALLTERAGRSDDEAGRLHQIACDQGDRRSCLAIELLERGRGPLW